MINNYKPIFSANSDIRKTAYMNWRMSKWDLPHDFKVIGEGFKDATRILMHSVLLDNSTKQADSLIFPISFIINHSIEMYLKAILKLLHILQPNNTVKIWGHDIKELFDDMESQIKDLEKSTEGLNEALENLKSYIDELYSLIEDENGKPRIEYARYPVDPCNNPFFYIVAIENVVVDIENLLTRYDEIMDTLEGIYLKYENEIEENNGTTNCR